MANKRSKPINGILNDLPGTKNEKWLFLIGDFITRQETI
jgi:hypothetical protein